MKTSILPIFIALVAVLVAQPVVQAQGTAVNYQGRLSTGGGAANGVYDLLFTAYDALTNGSPASATITNATTLVSNGLFTVTLDFGGGVFNGSNRWIEIGVRTNGGGSFTTLTPRQPVLAVPYAMYSLNATTAASASSVAGSGITGTIGLAQLPGAVVTNGAAGLTLKGVFVGDGSGITNLSSSSGAVLKLNDGNDFASASATLAILGGVNKNAVTNIATSVSLFDITAQTGGLADPSIDYTNSTPPAAGILGRTHNTGATYFWISTGTTKGAWSPITPTWNFSTGIIVGQPYTNALDLGNSPVVAINANANLRYRTNGAAHPTGEQRVLQMRQFDGNQANAIFLAVTTNGSGTNLSSIEDETALSLAMNPDGYKTVLGVDLGSMGNIFMDPGYPFCVGTVKGIGVETNGNHGWWWLDATNSTVRTYFMYHVNNVGGPREAGWKSALSIDHETGAVAVSNGTFEVVSAAALFDAGSTLLGITTIGSGGVGNTGNGSFGKLRLNTASDVSSPTLVFAGNAFINADSGGNLEFGRFNSGTTNDYMVVLKADGSLMTVTTNLAVKGTITGSGAALTNLQADAISGGLTVNVTVQAVGGGTNVLCFTNGVLRAVR